MAFTRSAIPNVDRAIAGADPGLIGKCKVGGELQGKTVLELHTGLVL